MNTQAPTPPRLLRQPDILAITGLSRSTVWRMCQAGTFPKPRKLPGVRAIAWTAPEVEAWLSKVAA